MFFSNPENQGDQIFRVIGLTIRPSDHDPKLLSARSYTKVKHDYAARSREQSSRACTLWPNNFSPNPPSEIRLSNGPPGEMASKMVAIACLGSVVNYRLKGFLYLPQTVVTKKA